MLVSVCIISYNHEAFIKKTIDGVLSQQTNFNFDIVISDDFSSDNTRSICENYANKHPDIIKIIHSEKNIGAIPNFIRTLKACSGKYVAFCEGDDYWIDPLKLQKQVDFLENNPECSLCFHDALILWDNKSLPPKYFCSKNQKKTSTVEDVIEKWFIPSASMVFRNKYINPLPAWFRDIYNGDWALQMLLAEKGKIAYINEIMSVYRKNPGALSGGKGKDAIFVNSNKIKLLNYFDDYSKGDYNYLINNKIILLRHQIKKRQFREKYPILYFLRYPSKILHFFMNKIK